MYPTDKFVHFVNKWYKTLMDLNHLYPKRFELWMYAHFYSDEYSKSYTTDLKALIVAIFYFYSTYYTCRNIKTMLFTSFLTDFREKKVKESS